MMHFEVNLNIFLNSNIKATLTQAHKEFFNTSNINYSSNDFVANFSWLIV